MRQTLARLRTPVILVASVAVLGASVGFGGTPRPPARAREQVARAETTPKPVSPFTPVSVSIPDIDMEAPTVPVGTLANGAMGVPKNGTDIAWWAGRKAGQGNVLLAGHYDWSRRPGSFNRLKDLDIGDRIIVTGDKPGKQLVFYVMWKKTLKRDIDATEVLGPQGDTATFGDDGEPVATLITCDGVFDTVVGTRPRRLVVRATLDRGAGLEDGGEIPESTLDT
jgi:sortase (surface protein transpeptidase)